MDYPRFYQKIGYTFQSQALLDLALRHRSCGKSNNERIEFLGDSIVNFIIAEALYEKFPAAAEGDLSRIRSSLVSGEALAKLSKQFDLGDYLSLGVGELKSGGHKRPSILAGAVEAVIGAIFKDSNFETCRACVLQWYDSRLEGLKLTDQFVDAKTQLQEHLQSLQLPLPKYEVTDTFGEAHNQTFIVECHASPLGEPVVAKGTSRRKAEQKAAAIAYEKLKNE